MQTRYVPVGLMYYEGVARLIDAGVTLPGARHAGDPAARRARRLSAPARARARRAPLVQEQRRRRSPRGARGDRRRARGRRRPLRLRARRCDAALRAVADRRRQRRSPRRRALPGAGGGRVAARALRPARRRRSGRRLDRRPDDRSPHVSDGRVGTVPAGSAGTDRAQLVARSQPRRTAAFTRSHAEPGCSVSQAGAAAARHRPTAGWRAAVAAHLVAAAIRRLDLLVGRAAAGEIC